MLLYPTVEDVLPTERCSHRFSKVCCPFPNLICMTPGHEGKDSWNQIIVSSYNTIAHQPHTHTHTHTQRDALSTYSNTHRAAKQVSYFNWLGLQ